jgi:outer membrane protein TolC
MKRTIITLFLSLQVLLVLGQNEPTQPEDPMERFFSSSDYALAMLYDAATKYAAEIERADASKIIAAEEIKTSKTQILSGISLGTNYSYGTWMRFNNIEQPVDPWNAFSMPARSNYSIGLNMSFPLLNFVNRRSEITKREMGLKQAEADRKQVERQIRQEVIMLYQQLVLAREVLQNYQDAYQSANINKELAEKRFREGSIQVDEQIAALDYHSKASLALQEAKNTYTTNLLLLEERIGTTINTLINGK